MQSVVKATVQLLIAYFNHRLHCFSANMTTIFTPGLFLSPQLKSFQHALSSHDCSRNVYVKKNGFTLHRNPIAQSTDGARGKIGFTEGRHAWEIWWEGPLGTVAVIGIATKRAPMQCQGYVALLGSDDQSWGWNLVDNNLLHNGEVNGNFPQCNNAPKYQVRQSN